MHIRGLALHGFASHKATELRLPTTGIIIVTGENGAGKSMLGLEAVSYGCFGKMLRERQPWAGDKGSLGVVTDKVEILVTKKSTASPKVEWNLHGERGVKYDSPTKARTELASVVGSYDTWRRTSVFSGSDATHFSLATDAERKLLIERILGHNRFDEALKACRADIKANTTTLGPLLLRERGCEERVSGLTARISDAEQVQHAAAASLVPQEKVNAASAALATLKTKQKALETEAAGEARKTAEAEADVRSANRDLAALNHDNCPTCGSAIEEARKRAARDAVAAANAKAKEVRAALDVAARKRRSELAMIEEEVAEHRKVIDGAAAAKRAYEANATAIAAHDKKLEGLRADLEKAEKDLADCRAKVAVLQAEAKELELVESVLGLRGVRAHLLGKALRALTSLANNRLSTLLPGAAVLLTESGDKLVMEVEGMPHGEGYKGCSSGERRRLDMAVLFALADLESLAQGADSGTLHLDEIDDGLDAVGIDAVADLLEELAQTRAVIIITHNKDMVARLKPHAAMHVHVDAGVVTVR